MSGIPVYTHAAKAPEATSQPQATQVESTAPRSTAPTATTASSTSTYPQARPGASIPEPTPAPQYAPILQPTPTTKYDAGPPAPQPGAVPIAPGHLPQPPKGSHQSPQRTAAPIASTQPQPYPPQMSIPPPTSASGAQPPSSSTSTTATASSSYPVNIPGAGAPRQSLEHPPGYQQNVFASDLPSEHHRVQDAANRSNLGGYDSSETGIGIDGEKIWNTVKKYAQTAGEKISDAESEVWRRINKE